MQPDLELIEQQISEFCNLPDATGEIAFFGGTFTALSRKDQQTYFDLVFPYLSMISGIRISTRPDFISQNVLQFCAENSVTTIELGVQSFLDEVLIASGRGYTSEKAIESCQMIKSSSFQLGIQLMPGLPGFSRISLNTSINKTIELKPDFVKTFTEQGQYFESKGQYNTALQKYKRAVEINPNYADTYVNIGVLYGKTGDLKKAIEFFNIGIKSLVIVSVSFCEIT